MFSTMLRVQCKAAAQAYQKAVSDLGDAAYKAGQAAACDCCDCKGAGGKCMSVPQYRTLQERVVVFCKYLKSNPPPPAGQGLKIPGVGQGILFQFSAGEVSALTPVCTSLTQLINQIQ